MECSERNTVPLSEEDQSETFKTCLEEPAETLVSKKMSKLGKKKRFTDEQIRALELMFESEEKLEPRRKLQLARELGLHPRQIAIWFQNRRARWKAKRIEQDYRKLRVEYDTLLSRFESLKNERESLQEEFQRLRDRIGISDEAAKENEVMIEENVRGGGSEDGGKMIKWEAGTKASCSNGGLEDMEGIHLLDEKESSCSYLDDKNGSLPSTERWYTTVDPCGMLDQYSCSSSHWLDIWT